MEKLSRKTTVETRECGAILAPICEQRVYKAKGDTDSVNNTF